MMKQKFWLIILLLFNLSAFTCDQHEQGRKIKLAGRDNQTKSSGQLTTTLHFEPKERRSIAIMFFQNLTGDNSLEWLQKGLTEMLIRTLSQSRSLSVLSTERLFEILDRLGESSSPRALNLEVAAVVGKEANVEAILTGHIVKSSEGLQINVQLQEPENGVILREESVEGRGLENIFNMVDQLSQKVKEDLLTLDRDEPSRSIAELTTNSLDAWRHYTDGVDLLNKLLYTEAIDQLEQAVEDDTNFVSAFIKLFNAYLRNGDIRKGLATYNRANTKRDKASQKEIFELDFFEAGFRNDLDKINEVIEKWVEQLPDDRDVNEIIAGLQFRFKNYEKAIKYYNRILEIDPKFNLAYNQLGYSYAFVGEFDKAIATLKKYQEVAPNEPNPFDSMGELYYILGDYQQAEREYRKALQVNQNFIASWDGLGNIYLDQGDYKQARRMYKKSIERSTSELIKARSYQNLARTHWRFGNTSKAIKNFENAFDHSQLIIGSLLGNYEISLEQNDSTKAMEIIDQGYDKIKQNLDPTSLKFEYLQSLFFISLWYDIHVDETIELLKEELQLAETRLQTIRLKFFLTLLYIKNDQVEMIDALWDEVQSTDLISILKEIRNISYSDLWEYYSILNEMYYNQVEAGEQYYNQLIELSLESHAKTSEMIFRLFLSDIFQHAGDSSKAEQQLKIVGAPSEDDWMVIGAFDNTDGFNKTFPPEKELIFSKLYRGKDRSQKWLQHKDKIADGYIDLKTDFEHSNWSVAYGLIFVESDGKQKTQIRLGSNESIKVWLNDKEVWRFNREREAIFDDNSIDVELKKGLNKILVKVCNRIGDWGYYFRLTDKYGNGQQDIRFISPTDQIS